METIPLLHAAGLSMAFASATVGCYGVLRLLLLTQLWPIEPTSDRTWYRELAFRIGTIADERGTCAGLRRAAARALARARRISVTPTEVVGESIVYALIGGMSGHVVTLAAGGAPWNVIPAIVIALVLFQVPGWNLRSAAERRVATLTKRLPYSLEVVVLATEAGASFEEALSILVREDPTSPLHEEFDQVLRDMHLGIKRRDALRALATRIEHDDLASLVMAMDIAEDLGTPVGETLRKQAAAIQDSRLKRAERLSHEAGPKMAVPNTMIMVANVLLILAPFLPKLSLGSGL